MIAISFGFICGLCPPHSYPSQFGALALTALILAYMIALCLVPSIPVLIAGIWIWRARKTFGRNHIFVLAVSLVWCCGLVFFWLWIGGKGCMRHNPPTKLEQLEDCLERFMDTGTPVHPNSKL